MLFNTAVINLIYHIYYYLVTNNKKDSVGLLYEISSNTIHNFIMKGNRWWSAEIAISKIT